MSIADFQNELTIDVGEYTEAGTATCSASEAFKTGPAHTITTHGSMPTCSMFRSSSATISPTLR